MNCPRCQTEAKKYGKNKTGQQRFHCVVCGRTFQERKKAIRLPKEKALLCLRLLVEGNSVRSTERITGVHRDTVLNLVRVVGTHCQKMMADRIKNIPLECVEADEIWGFVQKKEGHKSEAEKTDSSTGDAYTFVAIEAKSKLVACYLLGRRDAASAEQFIAKLHSVATGRFQLTTDGFAKYRNAVELTFGPDIDFAQLVKQYKSDTAGRERRYSPGDFVTAEKSVVMGDPDEDRISTSYVERQNLTMRMSMRRLTRLTNGFSKKWANLDYSLAIHFAYYNFCRVHQTLRVTPAMEAGITDHVWTIEELVSSAL